MMEKMHATVLNAVQHRWNVYRMDVKSMLLNGALKEEAYVAQPPGYEVEG